MDFHVGCKLKEKHVVQVREALEPALPIGERITAIFWANRLRPMLDMIVVTDSRVVGVFRPDLARGKGLHKEISGHEVTLVTVEPWRLGPRWRSAKLKIARSGGKPEAYADVQRADAEALQRFVSAVSGSPAPLVVTGEAQRQEGADDRDAPPDGMRGDEGVLTEPQASGTQAVPELPEYVTNRWLDENLPALPADQIEQVMRELERRGWSALELGATVLPHLVPKLSLEQAESVRTGLRAAGVTDGELAMLVPGLADGATRDEKSDSSVTDALAARIKERKGDAFAKAVAAEAEERTSALFETTALRLRATRDEEQYSSGRSQWGDLEDLEELQLKDWAVVEVENTEERRVLAGFTDQKLSDLLAWQWTEPQRLAIDERGGSFMYRGRFIRYEGGTRFARLGFPWDRSPFERSLEDEVKDRIKAVFIELPPLDRQRLGELQAAALPAPRPLPPPEPDFGAASQRDLLEYQAELTAWMATDPETDTSHALKSLRESARSAYEAEEISEEDYRRYTGDTRAATPVRRRSAIPERVRNEVWRRDQGRCVDCGGRDRLELDHIIPWSKRGSDTARNLELRCERCNRQKGASI